MMVVATTKEAAGDGRAFAANSGAARHDSLSACRSERPGRLG
jgi:hypothetical protein